MPLPALVLNAGAIGLAVLLTPTLAGSATVLAVPEPRPAVAESPAGTSSPIAAPTPQSTRFSPAPPQDVPDRNAMRDALEADDSFPAPPAGAPAASNGSAFVSPVPGPVTGAYGMRFHPILHYWRMHNGVDMTAACGTPVIAAYRGTVVQAGWNGGYGNLVVIDHGMYLGKHVQTKYAHLSRIGVRVGQVVETAQGIALSGTTGLSTACHLHFEVKVNGGYVDPQPYLTGKLSPRPDRPIEDLGGTSTTRPSASPSTSPTAAPSTTPTVPPSTKPKPKPTSTPTTSPSPTASPSPSGTVTPSPSGSPTPSTTPSASGSATPTPSPSVTPSRSPSASPSATRSAAPSPTPTPSASESEAPEPTRSAKPSPSGEPSATLSPSASPSASPESSLERQALPSPSGTATP